jgi:ribosomal protein L37AE/L43A
VTPARSAPRPCPLCGNPTATRALVEAHVGPTKQHPRADIVLWLCPPCALELAGPGDEPPPDKGQPW